MVRVETKEGAGQKELVEGTTGRTSVVSIKWDIYQVPELCKCSIDCVFCASLRLRLCASTPCSISPCTLSISLASQFVRRPRITLISPKKPYAVACLLLRRSGRLSPLFFSCFSLLSSCSPLLLSFHFSPPLCFLCP